ncbi:uncharacterized protein LOC123550658 [Mercenaria mercenaria]|uniref:uncharacterized protein LOC123550658 n=1 Tax=Mercenaria mercenaria TaxID=6596 RepID=UPI00234F8F0C|nr:uncharacterized protein LOC123550658 [Mercenaria mercenaria]
MRFKWKKSFRLITTCSVVFIILYRLSNNNRKQLFELYYKEDFNLLHNVRVRYSRLNVSKLITYTDNTKTLDDMFLNVTSTCEGTLFPSHLSRKESWRAVNRNSTAYVFAAYLVDTKNEIVIVGIKDGRASDYYCQFWKRNFGNQNLKMEEKTARVIILPEGHSHRYTAVLFQCKVSPSMELPTHVSIVDRSCETPMNLLDIQILGKSSAFKHRFTVCLTPLNFRYNRAYEIIEWIELNRLLGADKFIVYNYSSAINLAHVLEYYSKRGLTEVVQWNLPVGVDTWPREYKPVEIHYFGQIAALHDCLYRNKGVSEFIVNLDVDEFIIPHGENVTSWTEMLTQLKHDSKVYIFRNTFFKKEWSNAGIEIQNKSLVDKLQLVTLQKLQHETQISPPNQRSKYFAKSAEVSKVMIHGVPGVSHLVVPIEIGLVHHYRDWETRNDPPNVKVLDRTVPQKFGQLLIKKVKTVRVELNASAYSIQ